MRERQIEHIRINGFKSIKECCLDLESINILIGSNGAGKSNFISVFKLLNEIMQKNLQFYVNESGSANSFLFNGSQETKTINIETYFGNNGYLVDLSITDDNRLIFGSEKFFFNGAPPGTYRNTHVFNKGGDESKWNEQSHSGVTKWVAPILEKMAWRVFHFHDTSRTAKVKQAHKLGNDAELQYDASNLAAFLYRLKEEYDKEYKNIVATIQLIAPFFQDFYLMPNKKNDNITLRWKQKGSSDVFVANQLSDGTLRFICLATLLYQPSILQPETIIVDEPELGLHPYAITILSEMVKKTAQKKQIILSTQSVELLNQFAPEDVVVVNRSEGGTSFNRLNIEQLSQWLHLEYSLGDLWNKNVLGGRLSK